MIAAIDESREYELRHLDAVRSYAAGIIPYLEGSEGVTDVCVNADGRVWVKRNGVFACETRMAPKLTGLILRAVATIQQIQIGHSQPILETKFPLGGGRCEGALEPIVESPVLAIRRPSQQVCTLDEYRDSGILTHKGDPANARRHRDEFLSKAQGLDHAEILRLAIQHRRNILVAGATHSGKTYFLNVAIGAIRDLTPNDRLVLIEDVPELICNVPNHVGLVSTATVSQAECLAVALRLSPNRILVGEIRRPASAEVLVTSWNTGHQGGLTTIHANSAKEGLYRLEEMITAPNARAMVARAVGLVVFIEEDRFVPAGRKVREVLVVDGITQDGQYNTVSV